VKKFVLATTWLVALMTAGAASAADMSVKAPRSAPVVPASDWTGPYIGAELGGKWSDVGWTATSLRDPPGVFVGIPLPMDASSPRSYRPASLRAGGYLGYNWQIAPQWVVGVEGDAAWADKTASAAGLPGCTPAIGGCTAPFLPVPPGGGDTTSVKLGWDAGLRARAGWLPTPNLLLYATGGVAWQNLASSGTCGPVVTSSYCNGVGQPVPGSITNSTTRLGWTVGGGLEWKVLANWFARAEYRFAEFATWNEVLGFGTTVFGSNTYRYQLNVNTHMASFGIGYKFAKY
jgi:outer membrane immunogenic protein